MGQLKTKSGRTFFFVGIALACFFSYFFSPGLMSFDSLQQYRQALGVVPLNDSHPVVMVYLWRGLIKVFDSPGSLLVFHQVFYWGGVAVFASVLFGSSYAKILVFLLLGFCPPLFITSLHVWKDVGMLSAMCLATASLYCYVCSRHLAWLIIAIVSLIYAVLVRINGFVSVLPLLVFLSLVVVGNAGWAGVKRWVGVSSFVACFAIVCFSALKLANSGATKTYGVGTLIVWDMVSISLIEGHNYIPPYLLRADTQDLLVDLAKANSREANYPSYAVVSPYPPQEKQKELQRDWLALVVQHPSAYLKHRVHVFFVLLGVLKRDVYYPFHPGIDENEFGLKFSHLGSGQVKKIFSFFGVLSGCMLYRPWVYFLLGAATILVSCIRLLRKKGDPKVNALALTVSASGLLTVLVLFFIATAADFRYVTWMIMASLMSVMLLLSDFASVQRSSVVAQR